VVKLLTEQVGGAGEAEADGGPAIPPIDRTERNKANILTGSRDEALSPMSCATPEAGQCRVEMDVHFILDGAVCPREQGQQGGHIQGQKGQQVVIDQALRCKRDGRPRRGGRGGDG